MTVEKALNRIAWRLKNGWMANQNDVDALNSIIEFVNQKQKEQINYNQLFAKLYVHLYGEYLKYYDATVFDKEPQIELNKILEKSLVQIIQDFRKDLNESERYLNRRNLGLSENHPATRNDTQKENDTKILEGLIEEDKINGVFFDEIWDYETVEKNLTIQINAALNTFK